MNQQALQETMENALLASSGWHIRLHQFGARGRCSGPQPPNLKVGSILFMYLLRGQICWAQWSFWGGHRQIQAEAWLADTPKKQTNIHTPNQTRCMWSVIRKDQIISLCEKNCWLSLWDLATSSISWKKKLLLFFTANPLQLVLAYIDNL